MDLKDNILDGVREAVGLSSEPSPFDSDLLMYINGAVGKLNQNGIGLPTVVTDSTIWEELIDPNQTEGNKYFSMIPLFIYLSTKLLFDPPPPSSVEYHSNQVDELLWRLRMAYEDLSSGGDSASV